MHPGNGWEARPMRVHQRSLVRVVWGCFERCSCVGRFARTKCNDCQKREYVFSQFFDLKIH